MKTFKEILVLAEKKLRTSFVHEVAGICSAVYIIYDEEEVLTREEYLMFKDGMIPDQPHPFDSFNEDGTRRLEGDLNGFRVGFWWPPADREARYTWIKEQLEK